MALIERIRSGLSAGTGGAQPSAADAARLAEWHSALAADRLPSFVAARLADAKTGTAPWLATMTPAELGLARGKGIRPLAMVSGTCWYHYGYSWTRGHAEGWRQALSRLRREAVALGANAVLDVRLRTLRVAVGSSMDFTLIGTAVRIDGLPESADPVVATVPALEFLRLVEAGIIPLGIAVGARYAFLNPNLALSVGRITGGKRPFTSAPLGELGDFWEAVRRAALRELRIDAQRQGSGVLAHTNLSQLLRIENGNAPPRFLGRHIVVGTVVETRHSAANVSHRIGLIADLNDAPSPLLAATGGHDAYPTREQEGAI